MCWGRGRKGAWSTRSDLRAIEGRGLNESGARTDLITTGSPRGRANAGGRGSPFTEPGVQVLQLALKLLLLLRQNPEVGAQRLHQAGQSLLFLAQGGHLTLQLC